MGAFMVETTYNKSKQQTAQYQCISTLSSDAADLNRSVALMSLPTVDEVARLLDHRSDSEVGGNEQRLQRRYGLNSLVPIYIRAFPEIRNYHGRMQILFWICRYAKKNSDIVRLA